MPQKAPKFEIYKDTAGTYRFRLKAPNGQITASGGAFNSKKQCMEAIRFMRIYTLEAEIVDLELLEKARSLMSELKPEEITLTINKPLKLSENLVVERKKGDLIQVYEAA